MWIIYKTCIILCKKLQHPQIWVIAEILEPIPCGFWGMIVPAWRDCVQHDWQNVCNEVFRWHKWGHRHFAHYSHHFTTEETEVERTWLTPKRHNRAGTRSFDLVSERTVSSWDPAMSFLLRGYPWPRAACHYAPLPPSVTLTFKPDYSPEWKT